MRKRLVGLAVGILVGAGVLVAPTAANADSITYSGLFGVGSSVSVAFDFTGGFCAGAVYTIEWRDQTAPAVIGSGSSLVIPPSVVGHKIFARATITSPCTGTADGFAITVSPGTISATSIVLSGTTTVGDIVHATIPDLRPTAAPVAYSWWRDGTTLIDGAAGVDYALTAADLGHTVLVKAHVGGAGYNNELDLQSALSAVVTAPIVTTPVVAATPDPIVAPLAFTAVIPKITGTAKVGKTLKVSVGKWSPKPKYAYAWYANGTAIKKSTKSSLKLTKALTGKKITVKVTGTKTGYTTAVKTSKATKKVAK